MDNRIALIGIIVEDLGKVDEVNAVLHQYGNIIIGRMGLPYRERNISIISIVVDGTCDEINALTGKLGNIQGVNAKSMMTKK